MSTTIPPTTQRFQMGTCPACKYGLWADVDIAVDVSEPYMKNDGAVIVNVTPRKIGMRIDHRCWRDENGEVQHGLPTTTDETRTA